MLELKGITKKYNNIAVVKAVSFCAKPGEILGCLGPNGAGKTTTVKMLAGLLEPTAGKIFLNGKEMDSDIIGYKRKIGYIPEQSEIYPHLSGREYLQLTGRLRQMQEQVLEKKIDGLMELLGLSIDMHLPISNYSKGMRQKILIAAALLHDPDILLLDEPLSGLDVSTTLVFKDIVTQLAKMGKIIIYSSHILEVVERICNRVVIIDKGKIVADDSVRQLSTLMKLPSLESIFKELVQQEDTEETAAKIISLVRVQSPTSTLSTP